MLTAFGLTILFMQGCVNKSTSASVVQPSPTNNVTRELPAAQPATPKLNFNNSDFSSLAALTQAFAKELAAATELKRLYLDRTKIWNVSTRDVANLSAYLENEVTSSLSPLFKLAYDPSEADYLISVEFQQDGNNVRIFFKCRTQDGELFRNMDYSIARSYLPADSFEEELKSKAYKLVANILPYEEGLKIYVNPVRLASCDCVTDFSRSFTRLLRTEMVQQYREGHVLRKKPVAVSMRGLEKKAAETDQKRGDEVTNIEAAFDGADLVLDGYYHIAGDTVMVNVDLTDLKGGINNSSSTDITRKIIAYRLDNPTAEVLSDLGDKKQEIGSDMIKISTSRGSGDPIYHTNENMEFWVIAKKPVYLYIYDITNRSKAALIYPYTLDNPQQPLFPGSVKVLPEEDAGFEYKVVPPYGQEMVKVFAATTQLPIPDLVTSKTSLSYPDRTRAISVERTRVQSTLAERRAINPDDLVDYYRGLATKLGVEVYENSVIVETRP